MPTSCRNAREHRPASLSGHSRARNPPALLDTAAAASGCSITTIASQLQLGKASMKILSALLAAAVLLAGVGSHAAVRIVDDRGGQIGEYVYKYRKLRASGQTVMIDGLCASACTIVLGTISPDKICVTSNATLGFHAAYDFAGNGRPVTNPEATWMLYSGYPSQVRRWISRRGGLTPRMIFLRGKQLQAMYHPCY